MLPPLALPTHVPLVLDLDGTLHKGDVFRMGLAHLAKRGQGGALRKILLVWRRSGKAAAKLAWQTVALQHNWQPTLRWVAPVVQWAQAEAASGRPVLVCTGTPQAVAEQLVRAAGHLWPVIGTTSPTINLVAQHKAAALVARLGEKGFVYAGNSKDDLAVWRHAQAAVVVRASATVRQQAKALGNAVGWWPKA
jgi:phosphoserine phosphatase